MDKIKTSARSRNVKAGRKAAPAGKTHGKSRGKWSAKVMRESDALDLQKGVFTLNDPKKIAASLKRSAEASHRRKAAPYRSALSMLTFYINRGGKGLSATRKKTLERAKDELKRLFGQKTGQNSGKTASGQKA
jgi:hypothetical protein